MPAALDQSYDGIIVGAGHHGLVLGSYLAKCGLDILLVDRRMHYGGAIVDRRSHGAGLLPQPALDQSLPHQRDAVVQGPQPRRPRQLHHAALRVRPAASRRLGADFRPRPGRDAGQCRALLQEGRADLPRLEPEGRGDHARKSFCRSASPSRCRRPSARRCLARAISAAISWRRRSGSRSTWSRSCSRTSTSSSCSCSRFRCSAPGWSTRCRRPARWAR